MKFADKAALVAFIFILIVAASAFTANSLEQRQREEDRILIGLPYLIDDYYVLEYMADHHPDPEIADRYRQEQQERLSNIHAQAARLGDRLPPEYQHFLDDHPLP